MQKIHKKELRLYKKYISVLTRMEKDERLIPVSIIWENDIQFPIDKIYKISNKASVVGGCGVCYECLVGGQRRSLYFERTRWFIESVKP